MLTKKFINTLCLVIMICVGAGVLFRVVAPYVSYGLDPFGLIWLAMTAGALLTPYLIIYVNSRSSGPAMTLWDWLLQLVFCLGWIVFGLVVIFDNGVLYINVLSFELLLLVVIVSKAVFSSKRTKTLAVKTTSPQQSSAPPLREVMPYIVIDVLAYLLYIWCWYTTYTDTSGWSGLMTIPVLLIVAITLVISTIAFIVYGIKSRKRGVKVILLHMLGVIVSLFPIFFYFWYHITSDQLHRTVELRSTSPISLREARELVSTCRVETLHRSGDGSMELNDKWPTLWGEKNYGNQHERRTFDVSYFDELVSLARQKDIESRCGFIPTYDIERSKQPETKKWITQSEAEEIINKCVWSTDFARDVRYMSEGEVPWPYETGILLQQRLEVWNDDVASEITVVSADTSVRDSLEQKFKACNAR